MGMPVDSRSSIANHTRRQLIFDTGDLCRWREDGTLEPLGRVDDQVKIKVRLHRQLNMVPFLIYFKGFRVELDGVTAVIEVSI